jgi:YVTN family beta-propeller protein
LSTAIAVGYAPVGVAVSPDGSKAYVTNTGSNDVSVIAVASNTKVATIPVVGALFAGVAVSPDGKTLYVGNETTIEGPFVFHENNLLFIDTATNTSLTAVNLEVGLQTATGIAVTPDGSKVYVAISSTDNVFAIDTKTPSVVATIPVSLEPQGVAVTPDGSKVYVANQLTGLETTVVGVVSVIDTATNSEAAVTVGNFPAAFGIFIQPRFAGTVGSPNCHGTTVSVLAQQHGGLAAAATALGFTSVSALQNAIKGSAAVSYSSDREHPVTDCFRVNGRVPIAC